MGVKCFDVANMAIEDANERFAPIWKANSDKLDMLKKYCAALDELAQEFDGTSFEVEIDEIDMSVSIALECDEIIIESNDHVIYQLAQRAIKYGFSISEDGKLLIKFVFPSIWEKA